MMTVTYPKPTPRLMKSVASDEPRTISGEVNGRTRNRLTPSRPLNEYRLRATAIMEPRTVEHNVAMRAILRLTHSAPVSSDSANGCAQFESVNSCHTMLNLPFGLLNENSTITKIGRKTYSMAAAATALTKPRPTRWERVSPLLTPGPPCP